MENLSELDYFFREIEEAKEAYLLAEKKIEEARHSGATKLDFRNMKLAELPESIWTLEKLTKLDIGGERWKNARNSLTELSGAIGQLTQLQALDLSGNRLPKLPASIGQLTQLQKLDISNLSCG